jgi:UDP-N-acetylmuramyl pentapeptide phosphotransferase/UDP-N-acetylglucosamine-1-phosphate transferase
MILLIAILSGVVVAAVATALAIYILGRWAIVDVPNERSSHSKPTARGGGIGLAIGTLTTLAIAHTGLDGILELALVIAGLSFAAIGFADDISSGTPVRVRLLFQSLAAVVAVLLIWQHASHVAFLPVLVGIFAVVWIVSFVNAFNFMDGMNGISSAEAIIAGVAYGLFARHDHQVVVEVGAFALASGAVGFAPFNFPIARVFLGDVGSYFAGGWLAVLVVVGLRGSIPPEAMIAPVGIYVADTAITLGRRIRHHERWQQAHRQHTYQRLMDLGWGHTKTTGLMSLLIGLSSMLGAVSFFRSAPQRIAADFGIVILVAAYLMLPTLIERRQRVLTIESPTVPIDR